MAKPALDLTKLTPEEKLELIDELWTSISPEEFPLTEEQRVELHRRLDLLDEDGPTGVSWDSVRAEMTPRYLLPNKKLQLTIALHRFAQAGACS